DLATIAGIPRAGLARINANASSGPDSQWAPPFDSATMGIPVALALDAANVFVATPGGLQKFQIAAPGSPDPAWAPSEAFSGISSLAVVDDNLYVGGLFRAIGFPTVPSGGPGKAILARLDKATGETQAIWNTPLQSRDTRIFTLLEAPGGVYAGGNFTRVGDFERSGVAFVPNAPTNAPSPEPCQITCPEDITRPTDAGQCGANVSFAAPGTSGDCAGLTIDCVPPSGSFFPFGTSTVTCTANDGS